MRYEKEKKREGDPVAVRLKVEDGSIASLDVKTKAGTWTTLAWLNQEGRLRLMTQNHSVKSDLEGLGFQFDRDCRILT